MLVADLTFVASVNPIVYVGARPILVDAEPETYDMDPALVVAELDRRAAAGERQPAAIEVVHLVGHPAAIEPVMVAAARYGIPVVEDASEALGATYTDGAHLGKGVGTIGRIAAFSFNGNKLITTGGGGMVVTDDEALAKRARHLSTQARLPGLAYDHDEVGYNYRLTNVAAALGVAQLEELDRLLGARRANAARYDAAIATIDGLRPAPRAAWADPTFWLYTAALERPDVGRRDRILAGLAEAGHRGPADLAPDPPGAALRRGGPSGRAGRRRHLRCRVLPPVVVEPDRGRPGSRHGRAQDGDRAGVAPGARCIMPRPSSSIRRARHAGLATLSQDPTTR